MNRTTFRFGLVAVAALVAGMLAAQKPALLTAQGLPPGGSTAADRLSASDFVYSPPRGFGDRSNSWAQSMVWWRDRLYVGVGRESLCTSLFSLWRFMSGLLGPDAADIWMPYPPRDPDLACAPNGADLSLQAEIWRWTPATDTWDRVYQSPLEIPNPGPPPQPGKFLPYDVTFRGMSIFTEPDGTEALYAFGVNTGVMWDNSKIPPPRVLRTTDGVNWAPVPQTPGTFLGDLPFSADHTSFRSPAVFNGKLFVLSGAVFGQGALIASADPAKGDDAWFLAAPADVQFYEMGTFNGWLYLGTFNPVGGGYSIVKTRAEGTPPYPLVTVIPVGAFHPDPVKASRSVVSMHEYQGRLYVGTATMTEVLRINPDDTWDLVVGTPRMVPVPGGGVEWKYPLSGLDDGFGHTPNDHAWQMGDVAGELYIGTYNASIGARYDPVNGPKLAHNMGAHLYRTQNGWYYQALTTTGFSNLGDPLGGRFDYGIRTITDTPHGVFMGTANDYYGLAVFRAKPSFSPPVIAAPERLEVEQLRSGGALLSWLKGGPADRTRIFRAERQPIYFRTDLNIEAWNVIAGNYLQDTYIGPYEEIGATTDTFFVDRTVQPGRRYMYYVVHEQGASLSDQSNLVGFPLLTPPMTFATLEREVERMDARGRLYNPTRLKNQLAFARYYAGYCRPAIALQLLNPPTVSRQALFPESTDLEVMLAKLGRRLTLFGKFQSDMNSTEFCMP